MKQGPNQALLNLPNNEVRINCAIMCNYARSVRDQLIYKFGAGNYTPLTSPL